MKGLLGKKVGMTHIYDDNGRMIPVTVVEAGPCTVIANRTQEVDGYSAVQLGYGERRLERINKPQREQFKPAAYTKAGPAWVREIRLTDDPSEAVGSTLAADIFQQGDFIDVVGTTKGRGFQGVIKRYGFRGGRASHGGDWERRGGSIGMCESPGKVYRGRKMPGQMGNRRKTVQNLQVVQVRKEDNALLIKGAVPGPNGGWIIIRQARKK